MFLSNRKVNFFMNISIAIQRNKGFTAHICGDPKYLFTCQKKGTTDGFRAGAGGKLAALAKY